MAWLVDARGRRLELRTDGTTRIGWASDNDLVLKDSTVSRHHAEMSFDNGRGFLRDLGSSNGTFVEGSRVNGVRLNDGSRIRLGQVELTFRLGSLPPIAPSVVRHCAECGRAIQPNSQDCPYCGASRYGAATVGSLENPTTSSAWMRFRRVSWWAAPLLLLIGIAGAAGLWAFRQSARQGTMGLEAVKPASLTTLGAAQGKEEARRVVENTSGSPAETKPRESSQEALVARLPFVGCRSDGQTGPVGAPEGTEKLVQVGAAASQRLAYYKANYSSGVLAPRGWYCLETYGSSGSALFVTPQPINTRDLFSSTWGGISGPAIQLAESNGDTSGRFEVARIIARVFPTQRAFVESVINEGIAPAGDFPFGPEPTDKLIYQSDRIVEYQTPPNSEGLGTLSRLKKNEGPIGGVAILRGPTPDLLLLTVRLPPDMNGFSSDIIKETEQENAASPSEK
jgi:hypothetical protein